MDNDLDKAAKLKLKATFSPNVNTARSKAAATNTTEYLQENDKDFTTYNKFEILNNIHDVENIEIDPDDNPESSVPKQYQQEIMIVPPQLNHHEQ